jgi:alpha-D-xyloside xylohydrolase
MTSTGQDEHADATIQRGGQVGRRPRRSLAVRLLRWGATILLVLVLLVYFLYVLPFWGIPFNGSRHGRVPLTPPWALECWLWEDDQNTAAFLRELVDGYVEHDIPVGTVLIDSPWSQRYNDFQFDENRYPEPRTLFKELHDRDIHVVLWMTCMVNSQSKDTSVRASEEFFDEARTNGYLAGDGDELRWWKGKGGFIDYSNPQAMRWWHDQQQQLFSYGLDGWKLDGCDTLFSSRLWKLPVPLKRTASGLMTTRGYMDRYCREEYRQGLTQNSNFVILVRSIDQPWAHPEGFAPLDTATVTWVGDNRHTWDYKDRGLEGAISDILRSAKLGYCVIGSDVAGYHGAKNPENIRSGVSAASLRQERGNDKSESHPTLQQHTVGAIHDAIPPNLYIRWAQFSAFCGLFLNGGHGERRLWKRSEPELEIIRTFSWLHSELVPYMYSHVALCHAGGQPLMRPLKAGRFEYLFGNDLLIAPIHQDNGTRTISLPPGRWRYLFEDRELIDGPRTLTRDFPLSEFPVFVREGAIVPLNVQRPYTGFGDTNSAGFTTWLIYPDRKSEFTMYDPKSHPKMETTTVKVNVQEGVHIEVTGKRTPHILLVHADQKPRGVNLDGDSLAEGTAWQFDKEKARVTIKTREYRVGRYEILK